jgi:hypothetical protein
LRGRTRGRDEAGSCRWPPVALSVGLCLLHVPLHGELDQIAARPVLGPCAVVYLLDELGLAPER